MILLEERYGWKSLPCSFFRIPFRQSLAFVLRFLAVYVAIFAALVFIAAPVENLLISIGFYPSGWSAGLAALLFAFAFFFILLSLFGTSLAATAVGGDGRIRPTWRRGRLTFWRTFLRLALGSLPLLIAILVTPTLIYEWIGYGTPVVQIGISIIWFLWILMSLLIATAIAMAYEDATKRMEHDAVIEVF